MGVRIGQKWRIRQPGVGVFFRSVYRGENTSEAIKGRSWTSPMKVGYEELEECNAAAARYLTVNWFQMLNQHWSSLKRMHRLSRHRERWYSITTVVYSRSITRSLYMILYSHSHNDLMTCVPDHTSQPGIWGKDNTWPLKDSRAIFYDNSSYSHWMFNRHAHIQKDALVMNVSVS